MFKKGLPIFAFALAALASGVFAQAPTADLDVIVRDFAVDAPGFEEFLSCDAASNPNSTGICFQGNKYMYCSDGGTQLMYDAINCDSGARRGYKNGPDATITGDGTGCWENKAGQPVKVTRGMVGEWLYYEKDRCPEEDIMEDPDGDRDHIKYRYCARPTEGNGNCGSAGNMVGWFRNGGNEKSLKDVITLNRQADGTYQINYDYNTLTDWQNGDGPDNGFFPLDKFDGQGNTWGRQSLNFWCPTAGTTGTTPANICQDWYNAGGPRNHNAAATAATNRGARNKLHNYGFSLAGSGTFKYLQGTNDVFEFIGDDDMWIFIDGQLAADLGGVHLAAPAKLNINELAVARGWEYNSTHSINFFYMDRQTDGSNFKLKMSLSELSASRFGAPTINKTETTIADDNSASTVLYASTELDINDIKDRFVGNTSEYPIIVKLAGGNTICGYRLDAIEYSGNMKAEGQVYKIEGKVICQNGEFDLTTGDSLSFNVNYDQSTTSGYVNPYALKTQVPVYNKSRSRAADMIKMAVNTNKLKPDEFKPEIVDDDPWKPPFPDPDQVFGQGAAGGGAVGFGVGGGPVPGLSNFSPKGGFSSEGKVNSFGTVGNIIPANRTGELVITAYPSGNDPTEMKNIVDGNFFGLPPSANQNNGLYGVADPSKPNKVDGEVTGGYAFVKNGFTNSHNEGSVNGSMQISPTRCVSTINGEKARINCLNFNLVATQPFQLAVTVYDQVGNFVTQYRETVTEQEFRYITQGPNYVSGVAQPRQSDVCKAPTAGNYGDKDVLTTNGRVNVGVNIYPFSQNGRKFGNGVYIVKVDRVDLPFEGCYNSNGVSGMGIYQFVRYHADLKFGWMRGK